MRNLWLKFTMFIIIVNLFIFSPSLVLARRVIEPRRIITYTEKMALFEEWGIKQPNELRNEDPAEINQRLDILAGLLGISRKEAGGYTELLELPSERLERRARKVDELVQYKDLKVSYKAGSGIERVIPLILTAYSSTVEANLELLNENGINPVQYPGLLFEVSTFKLQNNINFLQVIGMAPTERPNILFEPTRYLVNNYLLLSLLNREVTLGNLGLNTKELVEKLRNEIKEEESQAYSNPTLIDTKPQLPKHWKTLLENIEKMLPAQEAYFVYFALSKAWFSDKTDILLFSRIFAARTTFNNSGLAEEVKGIPAYSLFVLMTAIEMGEFKSDFTQALLELVRYLANNERDFNPEKLADEFAKKFNLSVGEITYLKNIIEKEKGILDKRG